MADAGPPQRPPFNDPHDPRWYSDPASRGPGVPNAGSQAGGPQSTGSHATGSQAAGPSGPTGAAPPPAPPVYGNQNLGSQGYGSQGYGSSGYGSPYGGNPGFAPAQYTQQYGAYAPAEPRGLSIAALALGAAAVFTGGLLLVPQILAVVFGHIALRREPAGKPLALTGLILGYVMVLASILVFVAFLGLIVAGTAGSVPSGP